MIRNQRTTAVRYSLFWDFTVRVIEWCFLADLSGQPVRPRLGGSSGLTFFLDCLTVEDGTCRLFRNVGKNPPFYTAYSKIPKECNCLLYRGGNLKTDFSVNIPYAIEIVTPMDATRCTEFLSHHSHPQSFIYLSLDHSTAKKQVVHQSIDWLRDSNLTKYRLRLSL